MKIDLNSDCGESFGAWEIGADAATAARNLGQRGLRRARRARPSAPRFCGRC